MEKEQTTKKIIKVDWPDSCSDRYRQRRKKHFISWSSSKNGRV